MSKRSILLVFCVVVFLVGCAFVITQRLTNNQPKQEIAPSVASFDIRETEMAHLQEAALRGDCKSAFRLGKYHFYVTLQYAEAVKWFRLASKCPDVKSKGWLIAALLTQPDDPKVTAEIDSVLEDMEKIDPEDENTKSVAAEVQRRKNAGRL